MLDISKFGLGLTQPQNLAQYCPNFTSTAMSLVIAVSQHTPSCLGQDAWSMDKLTKLEVMSRDSIFFLTK